MVSAIISDTLLLKSPTTTKYDVKALTELAEIAGLNIEEYGIAMLKAGTNLDDFSANELVNMDSKYLEKNGKKFIIAQVNTVSIEETMERQQDIENAIREEIKEKDLNFFVFAVTDILNCNSEIIALGNDVEIVEKAFDKKLENNRAFLKGVVSRKKQLLPNIDKNI